MRIQQLVSRALCALLALSVLGIAGCTSEQVVSTSEFESLMHGMDDFPYRIDGEAFSGVVIARDGDDAQIMARMEFEDGYPYGKFVAWYENGQKKMEMEHMQVRPKEGSIGAVRAWDKEGQLREEKVYNDDYDLVALQRWCEDGELSHSMESTADGEKHTQKFSCKSGKQTVEMTTNAAGQRIGEFVSWHPDGQKETQATYEDGKLVGSKVTWYANGQKKSETSYRDGNVAGADKQWYANGQQKLLETYKDGKRAGDYAKWTEDGTLKEQGRYIADKKSGIWLVEGLGGKLARWHYGPDGFMDAKYVSAFASSLMARGKKHDPAAAQMLVNEGLVKVTDAIPSNRNKFSLHRVIDFPVTEWSYPVIMAPEANVQFLLDHGANINAKDSKGRNRLLACAEKFNEGEGWNLSMYCDLPMLKATIARGVDAKVADKTGATALHYLAEGAGEDNAWRAKKKQAQQQARAEAVKALVAAGTPINAKDNDGKTALMYAIRQRHMPLILALLAEGANPSIVAANGRQAVHFVILRDETRYQIKLDDFTRQMLKALKAHGADLNAPMAWDGEQVTLRGLALKHGLTDMVHYIDSLG